MMKVGAWWYWQADIKSFANQSDLKITKTFNSGLNHQASYR